jgi:ABC-type bacteriocin/lantibiotic exporter with double-glycine peptidase domain
VNQYDPVTLSLLLIAQQRPGECLAACALMVLRFLQVPADYAQMVRLLEITEIGAPFRRLQRLQSLGVSVALGRGTLPRIYQHLADGVPCIVAVETRELPYWEGLTSPHAVVVCGMNSRYVELLDPGFQTGPFRVTHGDFGLAWLERDEEYATVTL